MDHGTGGGSGGSASGGSASGGGASGGSAEAGQPRQYRRGRWFRFENAVMCGMSRAGVIPHTYLLTTTGRKTGLQRSNPVTIVTFDNKRWLVAPYGVVPWVLNVRASGEATISRRGSTRRFAVREVGADEAAANEAGASEAGASEAGPSEAGAVLKHYLSVAVSARPYFRADRTAPVSDFAAEASEHPVFELIASRAPAADV
ncbi:deazaflavin-dependent oxidoreductase (nitroreductase family) [Glaciihabitans tibetensis]|uniref:Deazaflavin-dependent oxidoreductase (Nitroreductase family) n=1 Tax=Glaciihabitans tibetensis TaxID=1266600 RepID=A0A2T0V2N1_9MICO|nr:nitroreductase family deazaflavin-dependent oxidoreductase [Glaciihabitans tibetensis]PRY64318.1 deazaflavin-dependent oxidoreductase (nitroreductase family) [Glaciihabitans tibetensis]